MCEFNTFGFWFKHIDLECNQNNYNNPQKKEKKRKTRKGQREKQIKREKTKIEKKTKSKIRIWYYGSLVHVHHFWRISRITTFICVLQELRFISSRRGKT